MENQHIQKSRIWETDITSERPIKVSKKGPNSLVPSTIIDVFKQTVNKFGDNLALSVKIGNNWRGWTYSEYYEEVMRGARSLVKLGLQKFDGVSIIGFNSPEWIMAYMSAIACGAIATGIYATNKIDACAYIANHSNAKIIFVEDEDQLEKFLQIRHELPYLEHIVQWSGEVKSDVANVMDWQTFLSLADDEESFYHDEVEKRIDGLKPSQVCALIYTSGTTGNPKGCMLSHDNLVWAAHMSVRLLGMDSKERLVSYLPLSHIAAQQLDIHCPLAVGYAVYFAQPDALKGSLITTLKQIHPTVFVGVPRVWEKMQMKIEDIIDKSNIFKKKLMEYAISTGAETHLKKEEGIEDSPFSWKIMKKLVYDNIREALGLDEARFLGTAAAPLSKTTNEFFLGLNMPLQEIYGMSECSGAQGIATLETRKSYSPGVAFPGSEMIIYNPDENGEGEVCYRGRHIMMGYKDNEEANAAIFDEEGYLHSGDTGRIDENGFLFLTGRIKELIITAGGENIAPVPIETFIKKTLGKIVSNVMVIGDRKQFLSCLLTLKAKPNPELEKNEYPYLDALDEIAIRELETIGSGSRTVSQAMEDHNLKKYIDAGIELYNNQSVSRAQQIIKWAILPRDFTIEGDEMTATMKLRRKIVLDKYSHIVDGLYNLSPSTNI